MSKHTCHAIGCGKECASKLLMCAKHWGLVPQHLQQRVYDTYRVRQEKDKNPSKEWFLAARAAIHEVQVIEFLEG